MVSQALQEEILSSHPDETPQNAFSPRETHDRTRRRRILQRAAGPPFGGKSTSLEGITSLVKCLPDEAEQPSFCGFSTLRDRWQ